MKNKLFQKISKKKFDCTAKSNKSSTEKKKTQNSNKKNFAISNKINPFNEYFIKYNKTQVNINIRVCTSYLFCLIKNT